MGKAKIVPQYHSISSVVRTRHISSFIEANIEHRAKISLMNHIIQNYSSSLCFKKSDLFYRYIAMINNLI